MKFVHTADWHIGRPFAAFDADLAGRLRQARLDAIDRIAEVARTEGAAHVLVAGDVWDQETPSEPALRQPLEAMARAETIQWRLMPGNHDPARPNGLWARLMRLGLPRNVRAHLEPTPEEIEPGVWLLPAPLTAKEPGRDLTAWMDAAPTPPGAVRVGLAHGPSRSFGSSEDPAAIDVGRADAAGLAYLALGDWHGRLQAAPRAWYSGTPEPDRFLANDPGWALAVTLDGAAPPEVAPHRTATHIWLDARLELRPDLPLEPELDRLFDPEIPRRRTLVRLTATGRLSLSERAALTRRLAALGAETARLEQRLDALQTAVAAEDLDQIETAGAARMAAERLAADCEDPSLDAAAQSDARRALDFLALWARDDAQDREESAAEPRPAAPREGAA